MEEIHIQLAKKARGWIIKKIRTLNIPWHVVPFDLIYPEAHPNWVQDLITTATTAAQYNQQRAITIKPILRDQQLAYFLLNGQLVIGTRILFQLDTRREQARERRENLNRMRRINRLKFNHRFDDALEFRDEFLEVFYGIEEHTSKSYLINFVKQEHQDHFREYSLNHTLRQLLEEFIVFYYNNRAARLNQLRDTSLDAGVETYVNNRLMYYKLINPLLPIRHHIRQFIDDSPPEIQSFFHPNQLPDLLINTKVRLISHLNYKLNQQNQQQPNRQQPNEQPNRANIDINLEDIAAELGRPNLDEM